MAKGEISWVRTTAEGEKLQVYARRTGRQWHFYARHKRFDDWRPIDHPPLEDWLELLDAVRRRIPRRTVRPEEADRVLKRIRELFPEADPGKG
jgi:hypothetical protein